MQLEILILVIILLPALSAWYIWLNKDREFLSGRRKRLFEIGLVSMSMALLIHIAFDYYAYRIGGFKTDFRPLLLWFRIGFWVSVVSIAFSSSGRKWSRILAIVAAFMIAFRWAILIWGM
jgi:hypothetical protein